MDAHRVEVLDRADDHDVVGAVADHLELELVPAADRLLDEHLPDRALGQTPFDLAVERVDVVGEPAAVAPEGERRPDDGRKRRTGNIVQRLDDLRGRDGQPAALHRVAEQLAILGTLDHVDPRAEELDAELVQDAGGVELDRQVERGLAAEGRKQGVRPLAPEDVRDALEVERLDVRPVGEARVGHDRRRIRVDDDRAVPVLAEHLERLATGVVELARLADHDRARPDHADRAEVASRRHQRRSSFDPALEDGPCVVRSGPGLGVELDGRRTQLGEVEPLDGPVVQGHVGRLGALRRDDCEAVVLARNEDAPGPAVDDRVVRAAMAERQLRRLVAGREPHQLVAEADPEHRHASERLADDPRLLHERRRVAGAVREEHAVDARRGRLDRRRAGRP